MELSSKLLIQPKIFSNNQYLSLFLLSSFLGLSLYATLFFQTPGRNLNPVYTDHFSHWGSAILFFKKRFDIYRNPINTLCNHGIPPESGLNPDDSCVISMNGQVLPTFQINWQNFPRQYPPGDALYHSGIAYLYMNGYINFKEANWLTIELYLFTAHLAFGVLVLLFFKKEPPVFFKSSQDFFFNTVKEIRTKNILLFFKCFFLLLVSYYLLMRWSLKGFYDSISILFLLVSLFYYRQENPIKALLCFSLGLFFHFRALWILPLLAFIFYDLYQRRRTIFTLHNTVIMMLSIGLIVISLYSFQIQYLKFYDYEVNNPLFFTNLRHIKQLCLLFTVCGIVIMLFKYRAYLTACIILWLLYMLIQMPLIRSWYCLFLLVIIGASATESKTQSRGLLLSFMFFTLVTLFVF